MFDSRLICRLCMGTESLNNLFEMKNVGFEIKISSCVEIKVHPEDGFPGLICKACKKKIKKFYNFKQNCLKVDQALRNIANHSLSVENDGFHKNTENQITSDFTEEFSDNSKEILYSFEVAKTEINLNCFENELIPEEPCKIDKTNYKYKETERNSSTTQCELCGFIFNTKDFKKHLSSHSRLKLFQCKFCPKKFTRSETNIIHMRSHMGIKPFICEICGQSSTKRQDLIRHMKIHSDEKNYECLTCGRQFKRSSDLCSHKRTHTGARPYKCGLCEKDYTSHGGLKKHKTQCKKELGSIIMENQNR